MADGISPIGLANTGIPGAPAGAPTQQPGMLDFLKDSNLGLALLQSGLSAVGGVPLGQAMSQGVGLYSQLVGAEKQGAQQDLENKMAERRMKLSEDDLAFRKEDAEAKRKLDEDKLKTAEKREAQRLAAEKAPKGVDDKLWKQALDMAKASAGNDEYGNPNPIDPSSVYRYYRTLDPQTSINMPFGSQELTAILNEVTKNPQNADIVFGAASELYGEAPMKRLRARWEAIQKLKTTEDDVPPEVTTPPATTTTTPVPSNKIVPSPYWGGVKQPQVTPYGNWGMIMGQ